jgi:urease subunit beta
VTDRLVPGEILPAAGAVTINEGRHTATVTVGNTGDRPVQVGSHAHFFEVNRALSFDRETAFGMRLDIPAGTAVRFEPGETTDVDLVAVGGKRRVTGLNGLTNGSLDDPEPALARAREAGYVDEDGSVPVRGEAAGGDTADGDPEGEP